MLGSRNCLRKKKKRIICPLFQFYIISIASVNLTAQDLERNNFDCIIRYICSIESNSETLNLTWRVTLPGQVLLSTITYDGNSDPGDSTLNDYINVTLYMLNGEYIESTLELTVQANASANPTMLECFIGSLASDSLYVSINVSGTAF